MIRLLSISLAAVLPAAFPDVCRADDQYTLSSGELSLLPAPPESPLDRLPWMSEASAGMLADAATPFGQAGSQRITILGGVATTFGKDSDFNLAVAYSNFIAENVELSLELGAWYFNQTGENEGGVNPALVFRWHFYNEGTWSVYADAGIGLLVSTGDVPESGTSFNLTPRAGLGFTRELTDDGLRLHAGFRWHHISNARINGDDENPSRDMPMLYVGVSWPF